MADNVSVIFSAQIGQLIAGVDEVKQSILSIANPINSLTSSLGTVGEAFAAAFAVDKIDEFFSHFAELAVQTQRNAALLGVSTQQIAGIDIFAKSAGGSVDTLVMSMERLGLALARAGSGAQQQMAALQALGITVKQFQALSPQDQLATLADKFAVLKDGIDKDAIAMALLGRGGAQMIPVFNQGGAAIRAFQEEADRAGTSLSGAVVAAFEKTHSLLIELAASFEGAGITIAAVFKPAFDGIVKVLIDLAESFTQSVRQGGAMRVIIEGLAIAANGLATSLAIAIGAIETLLTVGKAVAYALGNDFRDLGKIIYSAMTFDTAGVKAAWADMMASNHHVAVNAAGEMTTVMNGMISQLRAIWNSGADANVAIEQTKNSRLNILNKDGVSAALAAAQELIRIADMQYQQQAEKINTEFKLMQITESGKTQALLAALDVRHNAELAALDQEAAVHGLSKAQYQKVLNEKLTLDQKYALDRLKIIDKAAEDEAKKWKAGADEVAGAFNSQLRSLLSGQETFGQAMQKIAGDLALKVIEFYDKIAVEWIANQIRMLVMGNAVKTTDVATTTAAETAKTTAAVTGAAARAAAETTGASVGIVAQIGNALAVITADAAKTFAGVFAFLAPAMGPAAVGPAASSAATVEASAAGVVGLAVGTDYIISPGLAFLHGGESVVPAAQTSGPYTGGGQGNSMSIVFNVNALDGNSVQAFFQRNATQISRVLSANVKKNPSFNQA